MDLEQHISKVKTPRHFTMIVKVFCTLIIISMPEVANGAVVDSFKQALVDLANNYLGVQYYKVTLFTNNTPY